MDLSPSNIRHFTDPQQVIVNLPVTSDKWFPKKGSSTSCGTEPGALCLGWICQSSQVHTFPWAAPLPWARSPRPETPWGGVPASPRIVENPGTNHAGFCPDCGASLMAEGAVLVSWHWQRVEEGMWRANQRQKAVKSVTSMTLEVLGQNPPVTQCCHLGTQCRQPPVLAEPAGVLLQTPLCGSCSP